MHERWSPERVFLYRQPVDMRKAIDGLSTLVFEQLERDPSDRSMYVFVSRDRSKLKCLLWERNGFWLLYKRLESQRFAWPRWFEEDALAVGVEELAQLLDGVDLKENIGGQAFTITILIAYCWTMTRPTRVEYEGAFYHVMNRGRGRQRIFHGNKYHEAFQDCLSKAHRRFGLEVHSYCLMSNHYHLLVRTPRANLSRAMRHINGAVFVNIVAR